MRAALGNSATFSCCAVPKRLTHGSANTPKEKLWQHKLSPQKRFKSAMEQYYSSRSTTYDQEGNFHPKMVQLMADLADLRKGHRCLDLCTGTGQLADCVRQQIGPEGSLVAVDFSSSMLDVAAHKLSFDNVTLLKSDVEELPRSLGLFDRITCASGLVLLRDIPQALRVWRDLLAPHGLLVLDGPSDDAFIPGTLVATAVSEMDIHWPIDQVLGNQQRAVALLDTAGLQLVSFREQAHGSNVTLSKLEKSWETITPFVNGAIPPPMRKSLRKLYMEKATEYMNGQGEVWNDNVMNFVVATHKGSL